MIMKLISLYSNNEKVFSRMDFKKGVNAIIGEVKNERFSLKSEQKHSHNLGKSTLAQIIDFCLINDHNNSFLLKNNAFLGWEFYLEIHLNSNQKTEMDEYVTIRRCVNSASKISFKRHSNPFQNFIGLMDDEWTLLNEAKDKSIEYLDSLLDFYFLKGFSYRKFIGYLLRSQSDFNNVFKLGKNARSNDKEWKPLLARLLGFDDSLLIELYNKNDEIKAIKAEIKLLKKINKLDKKGLSEIEAKIAFIKDEISLLNETLNNLDFANQDREEIRNLVDKIDESIVELNDELYYLESKKIRLEESIRPNQILFDSNAISVLFEESGILFPNQLKRDFEQLIQFNRAINEERRGYLTLDLEKVEERITIIYARLKELNKERASRLEFLSDKDIFDKYKKVSKVLEEYNAELILLEQQKNSVNEIINMERVLSCMNRKKEELILCIQRNLNNNVLNDSESSFIKIRNYFVEIIRYVLGEQAIIKVGQNKYGYLEFDAYFESEGAKNEKGKGSSYKKLLCIAFDMAVVRYYSEQGYSSFIYHDGIFEGLDLNPLNNLISILREYSGYGIQHFITLLSYEMPSHEFIHPDEYLLKLNDAMDKSGLLFKGKTW